MTREAVMNKQPLVLQIFIYLNLWSRISLNLIAVNILLDDCDYKENSITALKNINFPAFCTYFFTFQHAYELKFAFISHISSLLLLLWIKPLNEKASHSCILLIPLYSASCNNAELLLLTTRAR